MLSDTHMNVRPETTLKPCGSSEHEDCGLRLILDRLGERWTVMTLAELSGSPKRYRELERALTGISQRMMTLTLRRLERDGYILRHVESTVPASVTYELSGLGRSFADQVALLVEWSSQHKSQLELARSVFDEQHGELR